MSMILHLIGLKIPEDNIIWFSYFDLICFDLIWFDLILLSLEQNCLFFFQFSFFWNSIFNMVCVSYLFIESTRKWNEICGRPWF